MPESLSAGDLAADIDEEKLRQRAYQAVKKASEWLAQERREADQQDIFPYSDLYTTKYAAGEDESGYMSSAEGMTALLMVLNHVKEDSSIYYSPQIDMRILSEDIEWMLRNDDEGGIEQNSHRATPYLPRGATTSFTDAVSFSTTTIQEALKLDNITVNNQRMIEALETNEGWLLKNYIGTPTDINGVGWAWCGADEMDQMDSKYPPQRYFTFSAVVALVDLYNDERVDTDDEKIEEVLARALKHLIADYWAELGETAGWTEFENQPYGNDLEPSTYNRRLGTAEPSPFSTSNTLFATAYIHSNLPESVWEDAALNKKELSRIETGIDYLIQTTETQLREETLEDTSAAYITDAKEETEAGKARRPYVDGTQPYTLLNAMIAVDNAGGPFEYRNEELQDLQLAAIDYILENCWTGDTGFKHFREEFDDEPVVIYATQVAIESLLWFGIKSPEEGIKPKVLEELEQAQKNISELLDDYNPQEMAPAEISVSSDDSDLLRRHYEFTEVYAEVLLKMEREFEMQVWNEVHKKLGPEVQNKARTLADNKLSEQMREINVREFLSILSECYHATTATEFNDAVDYYLSEYELFLLKPQHKAIKELSELTPGEIEDIDKRTNLIVNILETFEQSHFGEFDRSEVATDFRDRIESLD